MTAVVGGEAGSIAVVVEAEGADLQGECVVRVAGVQPLEEQALVGASQGGQNEWRSTFLRETGYRGSSSSDGFRMCASPSSELAPMRA